MHVWRDADRKIARPSFGCPKGRRLGSAHPRWAANMPPMEGDALLVGIGTFGIGTAGFASVAASLRSESKPWTPAHLLRVRVIVSTSFNVAFESVVPLIAALILGNMHSALVVASLVTRIYLL